MLCPSASPLANTVDSQRSFRYSGHRNVLLIFRYLLNSGCSYCRRRASSPQGLHQSVYQSSSGVFSTAAAAAATDATPHPLCVMIRVPLSSSLRRKPKTGLARTTRPRERHAGHTKGQVFEVLSFIEGSARWQQDAAAQLEPHQHGSTQA